MNRNKFCNPVIEQAEIEAKILTGSVRTNGSEMFPTNYLCLTCASSWFVQLSEYRIPYAPHPQLRPIDHLKVCPNYVVVPSIFSISFAYPMYFRCSYCVLTNFLECVEHVTTN